RDGDELLGGGDPADPAVVPSLLAAPSPQAAAEFALRSVRPNPFGARTTATFTLGRAGRVDLTIADVLGRHVRSVARGLWLTAGPHTIAWDGTRDNGSSASAGVYFVTLKSEGG